MIFEQTLSIPVEAGRLWDFMIDPRAVSGCMPGIEEFNEIADDRFNGKVKIKIGPISLRMEGSLAVVERDRQTWTARMRAEGGDPRIAGGVKALMTMTLAPKSAGETELRVVTDAAILGKLGEFGQPIMKKTADRILQQFVQNMLSKIDAAPAAAAVSGL